MIYRMKRNILIALIFNILVLACAAGVLAQSPTPTPSVSPTPVEEDVLPEVKDKIKQRLEETVGQSVDKVKGLVEEELANRKKRAFFGQLKNLAADTLTIESNENIYQASFSDQTNFVKLPGRTSLTADDLTIGDFMIAMGFLNDNDVLETRRVVVSSKPDPAPARQLFWGEIREIDEETIVFDDQEIELLSEEMLKIKNVEEPSLEKVELGDKIYVLASIDNDGKIKKVKKIFVVPVKDPLEIQTTPIQNEETEKEAVSESENTN